MASINNFFVRMFLKTVVKKNKLHVVPIKSVRASLERLTKFSKIPKGVEYKKVDCDGVTAEWNIPENIETQGVLIYLHGGGYVSGSIKTHRALVGALSKQAKTKCLSVEYRLAPEHPFPAGLDDVIKIYHWVLKQGVPSNKVVIAGDSAGGGLTLATLLRLRDEQTPLPAAGIMLSPWLDTECNGEKQAELEKTDPMIPIAGLRAFGQHYAKGNLQNPYASPINADYKGLPNIYIQVSDNEVLTEDSLRFEKKAKQEGVNVEVEIWKNMVHVWQAYGPVLPEAVKAVRQLGNYIYKKLKH